MFTVRGEMVETCYMKTPTCLQVKNSVKLRQQLRLPLSLSLLKNTGSTGLSILCADEVSKLGSNYEPTAQGVLTWNQEASILCMCA